GKKNDRSKKKMSAPNLMSHEAKSSIDIPGGRPKVEARISVEELRAKFKKQMSLPGNKDTTDDIPLFDPMEKSRASLMKRRGETGVVFDMQMAEPHCLWDSEYPECPERYTSVINRCTELGLLERCVRVPARAATRQEILSQHSEALHELVKSSETETDVEKLEEISSRYNSIYLHPKTSAMAELAAGSCVDLVTAVVEGRVHNGMAIVRPPGHHAMHDALCGYCYYNNVAIAAKHALDHLGLKRVLVVDWDVHHGQATQQMFYDDPRLLYFSVHRYEHGAYWPELRESDFDYTGRGRGKGYNCNVPLNATGLGNDEYLSIWTNLLLPLAYEFSPDLVLVSAGYDAALGCFEFCPDLVLVSGGYDSALGDEKGMMRVTPAFYCQLTTLLMPLAAGKLVVLLELFFTCACSLSTSVLNCISALRSEWQSLQYQGSYCAQTAVTDRSTRHSRHKHVPVLEFKGMEPPTRYPTRSGYAKLTSEQEAEVSTTLARLKAGTSLCVAPSRVVYVHDTAMEKHLCQTESSHPERPARTREIMKLLQQTGLLQRLVKLQNRAATKAELQTVHSAELVSLLASTPGYTE
ncbi:Histone deacetylase domain, partial [Trinorchestia longiramus]